MWALALATKMLRMWTGCLMKYRVLIEQDEDGVFVAEVPALPGCISQGHTRAEATANIKEAIALYLERLAAHNDPVSTRSISSCRVLFHRRWPLVTL